MKVKLKDSRTGEIKTIDLIGPTEFMWESGNYACDCNRSIFFYGLKLDDSFPCGTDRFELIEIQED